MGAVLELKPVTANLPSDSHVADAKATAATISQQPISPRTLLPPVIGPSASHRAYENYNPVPGETSCPRDAALYEKLSLGRGLATGQLEQARLARNEFLLELFVELLGAGVATVATGGVGPMKAPTATTWSTGAVHKKLVEAAARQGRLASDKIDQLGWSVKETEQILKRKVPLNGSRDGKTLDVDVPVITSTLLDKSGNPMTQIVFEGRLWRKSPFDPPEFDIPRDARAAALLDQHGQLPLSPLVARPGQKTGTLPLRGASGNVLQPSHPMGGAETHARLPDRPIVWELSTLDPNLGRAAENGAMRARETLEQLKQRGFSVEERTLGPLRERELDLGLMRQRKMAPETMSERGYQLTLRDPDGSAVTSVIFDDIVSKTSGGRLAALFFEARIMPLRGDYGAVFKR